jgi:hypothetical protein
MTVAVPAHIAERMRQRVQTGAKAPSAMDNILSGGAKFPYPRISIRAGRYRLVHDGVEQVVGITLPVVIVGANPHTSKLYYSKPFDPAVTDQRPDCFSNDGITPDASVTNPVSPNCAQCSHNVLGSKLTPSGAKSKLCADQKNLAIVPAVDPSTLYALSIPVSAMKGMREYMQELNNYGFRVEECVTELGFDDTTSYPRITFRRAGFLDEKGIATVEKLQAERGDIIKEVTREKPFAGAAGTPALAGTPTPAMLAQTPPQTPVAAPPAASAAAEVYPPPDDDVPFDVVSTDQAAGLQNKLESLFTE